MEDTKTIDLSSLSVEERNSIRLQILREVEAEKQKSKDDKVTYKSLVTGLIDGCFPRLEAESESLARCKMYVYKQFQAAIELRSTVYKVKQGQMSQTFSNADCTKRITLGYWTTDNYDDTAAAGEDKIRQYLESLGDTDRAKQAVNMCLRLLAKDKKGTLRFGKIISLRSMAQESGNADFIEGVNIIMDAYKPIPTKQFIRAEKKNGLGAWVTIPLGMTEAE
ncbi:MAG: DUF3164 family protein [Bacteroidales bacterium]